MYNLLLFTLLFTFVLIYLIYKYAFVNGKPHCNHFVSNVYLYLALSVSLCGIFINVYNYLLNEKKDIYKLLDKDKAFQQISSYLILSIIITFISIIILSSTPLFSKKGYLLNHFVWVLFLASISITLYPLFKSFQYSVVLQKAFIMTCIIFLSMTFIGNSYLIKKNYTKIITGLLIALFSIIITELYLLFTNQYTENLYSIISYIVIILFSLFIIYDTSRLYHYASICINSPNYPLVSTNLFLDILNIFVRFVHSK